MYYTWTPLRRLIDCTTLNFLDCYQNVQCPLIIRLLFNMYRKQRIHVRWGDSLSNMFSMSNGVKQGAIYLPYFSPPTLINFLKGSELLGLDATLVKCMQEHLDIPMTWYY